MEFPSSAESSRPNEVQATRIAGSGGSVLPRRASPVATEPGNEETWLGLAKAAGSLEERISALTRALALNPTNAEARQALYASMQALLDQDPRLTYAGESDAQYQLQTPSRFEFEHPKDRAQADPFPPRVEPATSKASRWLAWAIVGLLPAGLGTLVFAPLAAIAAAALLSRRSDSIEHRRAWVIIWLAVVLWMLGLSLFTILILHLL